MHPVGDVYTPTPNRGDHGAGRSEKILGEGNQGRSHIPLCSPIRDSHSHSPIVRTHVISTGTHIYIYTYVVAACNEPIRGCGRVCPPGTYPRDHLWAPGDTGSSVPRQAGCLHDPSRAAGGDPR